MALGLRLIASVSQRKESMSVFRHSSPVPALTTAGVVAILTLSCGGGDSPASSTPPTTIAPLSTPTPSAGTGSGFYDASCALGKGDAEASCERGRLAVLLNDMEMAMDLVVQQKPQIFDLEDQFPAGSGAYKIKDREAYLEGLVANLRKVGLCAERDADDATLETIRVKNANDFSEDYDIILSSGHMRRGYGMYTQTCTPAAFPVERSADAPPIGSGCGRPYPPPITRFQCKEHMANSQWRVLDSTPMVGPDPYYCGLIGFTDGRTICPVRPEGAEDRAACENWAVGKAKDNGQPGPTWTRNGNFCTGPESGCERIPENQYQIFAYQSGTYVVSAENGASCTLKY
jgi:hypothetical protein